MVAADAGHNDQPQVGTRALVVQVVLLRGLNDLGQQLLSKGLKLHQASQHIDTLDLSVLELLSHQSHDFLIDAVLRAHLTLLWLLAGQKEAIGRPVVGIDECSVRHLETYLINQSLYALTE